MSMRQVTLAAVIAGAALWASPAFAAPLRNSSGVMVGSGLITATSATGVIKSTANGAISPRGALVHHIFATCTTAPCQIALFDDTVDGSTKTAFWDIRINVAGNTVEDFSTPLASTVGLAVQMTGTGAAVEIGYE